MIDVTKFTGLKKSIALLVERRGTSGIPHGELVAETDANENSVYREVRVLVKCGLLAKVEVFETTRYYLYSILSECLAPAQKFALDDKNSRRKPTKATLIRKNSR